MPSSTLATLRGQVRAEIQEPTAAFWTDAELDTYAEEGNQDLGRVARLIGYQEITVPSATTPPAVNWPTDYLALRRLAWRDSTQELWFLRQLPRAIPPDWVSLGNPVAFVVDNNAWRLWPAPDASGTLVASYWRAPKAMIADGDASDLDGMAGEIDRMLRDYACYRATRKDENPTWQAYWATYQSARAEYARERFRATAQMFDIQSSDITPPPNTLAWLGARGYLG